MTTEPQSPLSETEKRAAFLAELEAERQRRIEAGKWSRGAQRMLQVLVADHETDREAQERALAEHLKEHTSDPKSVHAYQWILLHAVGPPPIIELPSARCDSDHAIHRWASLAHPHCGRRLHARMPGAHRRHLDLRHSGCS